MVTATSRRLLAIVLLLMTGACATVDFDYPKTESQAVTDTDDTYLGKRVGDFTGENDGKSGFYVIPDGVDAMGLRIATAERAERTLDVMYYLINADKAGYLIIQELMEAAERGVRVRLLLDDVLTKGYDRGMLALDAHPNIQIRIFNPFARRSARAVNFLGDFKRLNKRMHNKAFIADNQAAIIGGRNIGDEYFVANEKVNFGDLDLLAIGPVVQEISTMFDLYWNHRLAMPVPAVSKPPEDPFQEIAALRSRIADALIDADTSRYESIVKELMNRSFFVPEDFHWVPYQFIYDSPNKATKLGVDESQTMIPPMRDVILAGRSEVMIISPYFVPTDKTIQGFARVREKGVDVTVITNGLASNNHLVVHSGYAPKRKPLLEHGVRILEVRPDRSVAGVEKTGMARSGGTLHAKAFIVDREVLFLGTFNWDPRSAYLNTEMGIILYDAELAAAVAASIDASAPTRAYEVQLDERGKLRWVTHNDGEEVVYTKEPESTAWQRFKVKLYGILPIEKQL
jgi:putative cardiolipin synthase